VTRRDSDTAAVIVAERISKRYGPVTALADVSFAVTAGTIHGLLGPNGAGKSTTIRLITGFARADSGELHAPGRPGHGGTAGRLAYQPEEPALYDYLTVTEFLALARRLGDPAAEDSRARLVERFELGETAGRLIKNLSAGTRRKVAIAAALVQDPTLLVLDEPTNGLDTTAVVRLKEELRALRDAGRTVLLSTHILDFAAGLCDDVTMLRSGTVAYTGSVAALLAGPGPEGFEARVRARLGI
jgi:ABC-2 type transport system ATP-binding protein